MCIFRQVDKYFYDLVVTGVHGPDDNSFASGGFTEPVYAGQELNDLVLCKLTRLGILFCIRWSTYVLAS